MSLLIVLFSLVFFPNYPSFCLGLRLPLRQPQSSDNPLHDLYRSSLLRAHRIKNPHSKHSSPIALSVSPHSYGGYSLPAAFGTPPQPFPLLLDTGSQLTWIPCTTSYLCRSCPSRIPAFLPKLSNTSRLVGCRNPKCKWIHPASTRNCSQTRQQQPEACSPYFITYGSGSTAGLLLSETLRLSDQSFPDFGVGCSLISDRQPAAGIAGFGRGSVSIPAQLNLTRFSYCLISRRFDENPDVTGTLILNEEKPNPNPKNSLIYTPFLKNPSIDGVFSVYYYVGLRKITVGGKKVKIPHRALVAGPDDGGGVIVDSGTTFTYVHPTAFDPLLAAFVESVGGEFNRRPVPPVALSIIKPFSTAPLFKTLGFQFQAPTFPPQFQQVRHFRKDRLWVQKKKKRKARSRGPTAPIVSKVKKYKIKGYSSFKSRFRARNDGTILRWRSGKAHNAHSKSKEAKRRLRKPALVHAAYATVMKKLNFCG